MRMRRRQSLSSRCVLFVVPSTSSTSVTLLGRDRIIQVEFKGTHPSSVASARTGRGPGIPRQSEVAGIDRLFP